MINIKDYIIGTLLVIFMILVSLIFKAFGWIFALIAVITWICTKVFRISKSVVVTVSDSIKYPSKNVEIDGKVLKVLDKNYNFRVLEVLSSDNVKYQVGATIKGIFRLGDSCYVKGKTLHHKKYDNYVVSYDFKFTHNDEEIQIEKRETSSSNIRKRACSRCGSKMVVRTGPRGKFYGCTSYPKCRYTASHGQ